MSAEGEGALSTLTPTQQAAEAVQITRDFDYEFKCHAFIRAYNELAERIHTDNVAKGFWPKKKLDRNVGEALMLTVTELAEAMEAYRHQNAHDDKLPEYLGIEVELADAIIRIMDLGAGFEWLVSEALVKKLAFNRSRPYKHGKDC